MASNSTTFKKGQSGNPSGKSRSQWLTDALRLELTQNPGRARNIANKVIEMAETGDLAAVQLIWNRLEGTPTQKIDVTTTTQSADPAEVDRRIEELAAKLRIGSIPALIDVTAEEVPGDDTQRH
jgi:hypothetical protein